MKTAPATVPRPRVWLWRLIEIIVGIALVIGIGLAWPWLNRARIAYWQQQQSALHESAKSSQQLTLQVNLNKHQHDIDRIRALLLNREEIASFVGTIEQEATRRGVQVVISDITDDIKLDKKGKPLPVTGPVKDVRLHLAALGQPDALLHYLYALEHLPYIITVAALDLRSDNQVTISGLRVAPAPDNPDAVPPPGRLEATLLLTITNDTVPL